MKNWAKILSTEIEEGYRIAKCMVFADDVRTADEVSPFGVDSNAPKDFIAIYSTTDNNKPVILGYIDKSKLEAVKPGETRFFSLKGDGSLSAYIWLKDDGKLYLQGEGDFGVRYNKLEEAYNQLKTDHNALVNDINTLKTVFSAWVIAPNDGGSALKTAATSWYGATLANSTGDITPAKINNIIVPQ